MTNQTRSTTKLILGTALAGASLMTAACAGRSSGPADTSYVARDVESLYGEAKRRLDSGQATLAAALFDEVERQHPYSVWATKAQLMTAYASYQADDYDEAVLAAERFIELHPGNLDAAYAHYLIGISYYERISDVGRDQRMTELALDTFEEIGRRYPASKYARDAALKAALTDTVLVDAAWLAQLADEGGVLPRCQDLPEGARVTLEEMEKWTDYYTVGVLVISYPWWAPPPSTLA